MVLLRGADLAAAYKTIRERWQDAGGEFGPHLQVFVGGDVDGICALRVFMTLLISERILFQVEPVESVRSLAEKLSALPTDAPQTIVTINCGGLEPLSEYLSSAQHEIHVLDAHRPLHLGNIQSDNVHVWQTGDVESHLRHSGVDRGAGGAKRRKFEHDGCDSDDSDRAATGSDRAHKRYYGGGCWRSVPSAVLVEQVARAVMPDPPDDTLFGAAVSLTDALLCERMSRQDYDVLISEYVQRISIRNLKKPALVADDGDVAYHDVRLTEGPETKLSLLRSSSLWDALWHCPHVAARLRLYTSTSGQADLRRVLIGQLGLESRQFTQEWETGGGDGDWGEDEQQEVLTALLKILKDKWHLTNLTFKGVLRRQGYRRPVSAADTARMMQAVLARPCQDAAGKDTKAHWTDTFWEASEVLTGKTDQGLAAARALQEAVERQARYLLRKEHVRSLGPNFRYAEVSEASLDNPYFTHPLALGLLARVMRECLQHMREGKRKEEPKKVKKPILLITFDHSRERFLFTAASSDRPPSQRDPDKWVNLVAATEKAAFVETQRADSFDRCTVRLARVDRQAFLDGLALELYRADSSSGVAAP